MKKENYKTHKIKLNTDFDNFSMSFYGISNNMSFDLSKMF